MSKINRITLFKFNDTANIADAAKKYASLTQDAVKDGSPYIVDASGKPTYDDPRNQGFNFIARTVFNSKDDMVYYDTECAAHGEIKAFMKGKVAGPPLMVYTDL